ncbi:MAG: hypothetical protein J3K34DRAFT_522876 [Monoraphidium minutum]|nr:MAG: hypothetical protein J3K34DRAFT_522876 [Monoraphidium minutum]
MAPPQPSQQQELYQLPRAAVGALAAPALRLELHCITFSHYCTRARWALASAGLPYDEVGYLPLAHMPGIVRLLRRFKAAPGASTASSKSPASTPVLAVYAADGAPLFLLQNSALIARWAALRAAALGAPPAALLYGPGLGVAEAAREQPGGGGGGRAGDAGGGGGGGGGGRMAVVGSGQYYESVADLELRLSNGIGLEARRIIYYHLLPCTALAGRMFYENTRGGGALARALAWPVYFLCRAALPRLLKIDARAAARGRELLLAEFEFFGALLERREREAAAAGAGAAGAGAAAAGAAAALPYYLCGPQLSAADVSLATLAGHLLALPPAHACGRYWVPANGDMPPAMQELAAELAGTRAGAFARQLWEVHGPALMAGAEAAGSFGTSAGNSRL